MREMEITIAGLGFIMYSPPAVKHIPKGSDYLQGHFFDAEDVVQHVKDCQLTAFGTGTPGTFRLRFHDGPLNTTAMKKADFSLRLGIQVHEERICIRDLYDLMDWSPKCRVAQQLPIEDGWYRLSIYTLRPESGILGDNQVIDIHIQKVQKKPSLRYDDIPSLCPDE